MTDWNKMSPAAQRAAQYAAYVDLHLEFHKLTSITMTEATTAIWGTSGTGNPNAKRIIEACADFGFLRIVPHGKRTRYVERGSKPIPAEAMSQEDRDYNLKMKQEIIDLEVKTAADRMMREIKNAPSKAEATQAFYGGLRDMLGNGRRR